MAAPLKAHGWKVHIRAENLSRSPTKFSYDRKFLFVNIGLYVGVFSTSTGERLFQLHGGSVLPESSVHFASNPENSLQLITCTSCGIIRYWDYNDGAFLKEVKLKDNVSVYGLFPSGKFIFLLVQLPSSKSKKHKRESKHRTCRASLHKLEITGRQSNILSDAILWDLDPTCTKVAIGFRASFAAAVKGDRLSVFHSASRVFKTHYAGRQARFSIVVSHPTDQCLATGEESGRIIVWHKFIESNHPIKRILHWHTLQVRGLAFSAEGSYLFSGGGECTLVKWLVAHGKRDFLPRLGAPIQHISTSPDNQVTALSLADNGIHLLHLDVVGAQIIQGMVRNADMPVPLTGLVPHPQTRSLILNGRVGQIQFFDPNVNKQLFSVEASLANKVTEERSGLAVNIEVDHVVSWGEWVVTSLVRGDAFHRLRFWRWSPGTNNFSLNTDATEVHRARVTSLAATPDGKGISRRTADVLSDATGQAADGDREEDGVLPLVCSTSLDRTIKLWTIRHHIVRSSTDAAKPGHAESDQQRTSWYCLSVLGFHQRPASVACFSQDASLLAVALGPAPKFAGFYMDCGSADPPGGTTATPTPAGTNGADSVVITLWDTRRLGPCRVLVPPAPPSHRHRHYPAGRVVKSLEFGRGAAGHVLTCVTSPSGLYLLDVVTGQLLHAVPAVRVVCFMPCMYAKLPVMARRMAIVTEDGKLQMFDPLHPNNVSLQSSVRLPDLESPIRCGAFLTDTNLLLMDGTGKLIEVRRLADSEVASEDDEAATAVEDDPDRAVETNMQRLFNSAGRKHRPGVTAQRSLLGGDVVDTRRNTRGSFPSTAAELKAHRISMRQLVQTPVHTLPPMDLFCEKAVDLMLFQSHSQWERESSASTQPGKRTSSEDAEDTAVSGSSTPMPRGLEAGVGTQRGHPSGSSPSGKTSVGRTSSGKNPTAEKPTSRSPVGRTSTDENRGPASKQKSSPTEAGIPTPVSTVFVLSAHEWSTLLRPRTDLG